MDSYFGICIFNGSFIIVFVMTYKEGGELCMAMNYNLVWENDEYARRGYNGKCPFCNGKVTVLKSSSLPTTPGTTCRIVVMCSKCKIKLRIGDATENVLSRNDELDRGE